MTPGAATVVGRGPAGLMAATLLTAAGWSVHVVSSASGTLPLWSGRLDFRSWDQAVAVDNPWRWWEHHGEDHFPGGAELARWKRLWSIWAALVRQLGAEAGVPECNRWTVTPMGRRRPVFWTPPWELALDQVPPAVAVVGLEGFLDFEPELAADGLRGADALRTMKLGAPPDWHPGWSGVRWAAFLDTGPGGDWLERQLGRALDGGPGDELVVLPQVLGLRHTELLRQRLERRLGRTVREVGLVPPGLGGMRREARWLAWLLSSGVQLHRGTVEAIRPAGGVTVADGRPVGEGPVILATGGVLGGGVRLSAEGTALDAILGCPLGHLVEGDDPATALRWGLTASDGAVAGRQLAGCDPDVHGDGGAVCLWTAAAAAERLAPGLVARIARIGQAEIGGSDPTLVQAGGGAAEAEVPDV